MWVFFLQYKQRTQILCFTSQNKPSIRKCVSASWGQFACFILAFLLLLLFFYDQNETGRRIQTEKKMGIWKRAFQCHVTAIELTQKLDSGFDEMLLNSPSEKYFTGPLLKSPQHLAATCTGCKSIWFASGRKPLPCWLGAHIIMCNERKITCKSQLVWDHAGAHICS